jgi:hypothetical protein
MIRPAHGLTKPPGVGATYLPAAGTDVAGGKCLKMARQSGFGPTCRLVTSPEVGPGATVGTLEQGYPLL